LGNVKGNKPRSRETLVGLDPQKTGTHSKRCIKIKLEKYNADAAQYSKGRGKVHSILAGLRNFRAPAVGTSKISHIGRETTDPAPPGKQHFTERGHYPSVNENERAKAEHDKFLNIKGVNEKKKPPE